MTMIGYVTGAIVASSLWAGALLWLVPALS